MIRELFIISKKYLRKGSDLFMAEYKVTANNQTITGSSGADLITSNNYITYENVVINAGGGDDTVGGYNNYPRLKNSTINGEAGNDLIMLRGSYLTVNGGDGDDTIEGYYKGWAEYSAVNGGAGNDSISTDWSSTVTGGTGDDTIRVAGNSVIKYANGDGNDVVLNYRSYWGNLSSQDTINVTSGTVNSITGNGNDVVLHIGDGSMTLKSVRNRPIFYQEGNDSLKGAFFDGSKIQDMVVNDVYLSEVTGTDGADYIYNIWPGG